MLTIGVMEDGVVRCVMQVDGEHMSMTPGDGGLDVDELARVLRVLADALDDGPRNIQ